MDAKYVVTLVLVDVINVFNFFFDGIMTSLIYFVKLDDNYTIMYF